MAATPGRKVNILSTDSVRNSLRMEKMTETEVVTEYLSYPKLPYGQTLKVDKIAILNYDTVEDKYVGKLRYLPFREQCPMEFKQGQNPEHEYMDDEQVAPVIFISGENKYRVKKELWFPLCAIIKGIQKKQGITGKMCLPVELLLDETDQFVLQLYSLSRYT